MPTSHTPKTGPSRLVQFALFVPKMVRKMRKFANKYMIRLYFSKLWIWGSPVRAGEAVPSKSVGFLAAKSLDFASLGWGYHEQWKQCLLASPKT